MRRKVTDLALFLEEVIREISSGKISIALLYEVSGGLIKSLRENL
jgi:hypothetical protein